MLRSMLLALVMAWPVGIVIYILAFLLLGGPMATSPMWMKGLFNVLLFPWWICNPGDLILGCFWLGLPYSLLIFPGLGYSKRLRKRNPDNAELKEE